MLITMAMTVTPQGADNVDNNGDDRGDHKQLHLRGQIMLITMAMIVATTNTYTTDGRCTPRPALQINNNEQIKEQNNSNSTKKGIRLVIKASTWSAEGWELDSRQSSIHDFNT